MEEKKKKAHNRSTALKAYLGDVCKQKSRHKHTATDTENIKKVREMLGTDRNLNIS